VTPPRGLSLPVVTLFLLTFALALPTADNSQTPGPRIPVVQDWSHRHLIFGGGGSLEALVAAARDPRARNQWLLRNHGLFQATRDSNRNSDPFALDRESGRFDDPFGIIEQGKKGKGPRRKEALDIDWAFSLGTTGGMAAGTFPAKYSFDVTQTPSCTNDFVVFPINATPSATQASIVALQNLYVNTGGTGACSGTAPTVRWAYYVNGGGPVRTSPVLSLDGTKVAFIESMASAVFSVLTPVNGEGTGVASPQDATATTPSRITRLAYTPNSTYCSGPGTTGTTNTRSSPFVDYTTDTAYVGADNGYLYKIHPVFGTGTPAVTACVQVRSGFTSALTSPVYDARAQRVFVADGTISSYVFAVAADLLTVTNHTLGSGTVTDGPIVDGVNNLVYLFGGVNGQQGYAVQIGYVGTPFSSWNTSRIQIPLNGSSSSSGTIRSGGFDDLYFNSGPNSGHLYACGYQGTVSPGYNDVGLFGFKFVSGTLTSDFGPNTNLAGTATALPASCSPITSFKNGSVDRMFVGTTQATSTTNYSFEMWNITSALGLGSSPSATILSNTYTGGTSGIIVDNQGTGKDQSSVYFGTLATSTACSSGYCAVKLTQSGLQ